MIITGGFVINANHTINNEKVVSNFMDIYHERLPKHTHMDKYQFNEDYKSKHILTTFTPAAPVESTFFKLQDSLHNTFLNKINATPIMVTPLLPRWIVINQNK